MRSNPEVVVRRLAIEAYDRLKQGVIESELAPGSLISQSQVEERYNLSRAAVRSALAHLEQEGLVEAVPRRGYRVAPFTVQDIEEVFAVRGLVEPIATRLAAGRLGPEALAELNTLNEVSFTPGDPPSERQYVQANRAFHMRIAQASGNRRLAALIQQIHDDSMRMTFLTMSFRDFNKEWKSGHERIIAALTEQDGDAAEHHSRTEIAAGREFVLRTLLSNPAIWSTNLVLLQDVA